ncbi:unnamed protein product [Lactuca saligna]|uniref:Uncharacterized protein n=1 Tax=Lactuca saligna TaxID=75948 RepID=A0AA35VR38_LACSI|nr:unnamed protein product [Lactuca saligna]
MHNLLFEEVIYTVKSNSIILFFLIAYLYICQMQFLSDYFSFGWNEKRCTIWYIKPLAAELETEFEFENMIIGQAIPSSFIPHIEKCFMEAANSWCFSCYGYDIAKFSEGGILENGHFLVSMQFDLIALVTVNYAIPKMVISHKARMGDLVLQDLYDLMIDSRLRVKQKDMSDVSRRRNVTGDAIHRISVLLMCIVSSKVARDVVKAGNKFF